MNKTKIEWVRNPPSLDQKDDERGMRHDKDGKFSREQGYIWNPITGCQNGCPYCYARKLAKGRLSSRYLAGGIVADEGENHEHLQDPFYPRFWPEKLHQFRDKHWYRMTKAKGIFVCDMSDLFGIGVPEDWTAKVMDTIKLCPQHRFYLLTKQPQNLIKWSPFPENCWVGVSVTNPNQLAHAINGLALVEAKVKYYSFEPLLERMIGHTEPLHPNHLADIQWVIIGSQTKPYKPPKIEWVAEIVDACDKAHIPVFLKDNLNPIFAENDCKHFKEFRDKLFAFKDYEPEGKTRWHLKQEMPR